MESLAATTEVEKSLKPTFSFLKLAPRNPFTSLPILCVGQPGAEDLEAKGNKKAKYNLFETSEGNFRGMVASADPQDNSQIGTLKHDAWTYWGHSGAPLVRAADGKLIGLHSSWDDQTSMRHGVPRIAIQEFLGNALVA